MECYLVFFFSKYLYLFKILLHQNQKDLLVLLKVMVDILKELEVFYKWKKMYFFFYYFIN